MRYVTVPGIGGSGPDHWQTLWEADLPVTRFAPASWEAPEPDDWADALSRAVSDVSPADPTPGTVLVAHSLGCLAAASWLHERGPGGVVAALLVAVPDPSGPAFPPAARGFGVARERLPVPALVVVSDDDPYGSPGWAFGLAAAWGAAAIGIGVAGHVNAASGLGAWPQGRDLLGRLVAEVSGDVVPPPGFEPGLGRV